MGEVSEPTIERINSPGFTLTLDRLRRFSLGCRLYHFFAFSSFKIWLSNIASARALFNRLFSCSNCLSLATRRRLDRCSASSNRNRSVVDALLAAHLIHCCLARFPFSQDLYDLLFPISALLHPILLLLRMVHFPIESFYGVTSHRAYGLPIFNLDSLAD